MYVGFDVPEGYEDLRVSKRSRVVFEWWVVLQHAETICVPRQQRIMRRGAESGRGPAVLFCSKFEKEREPVHGKEKCLCIHFSREL